MAHADNVSHQHSVTLMCPQLTPRYGLDYSIARRKIFDAQQAGIPLQFTTGITLKSHAYTPATAELELVLLSAEAESLSDTDFYAWLCERGLSSEAAIRLKSLVDLTVEAGNRTVNIGKLIAVKLIEFVKTHPNLAVGIAIGAALAALVGIVPFLGTYLAPIAAVVGASVGAVAGHRKDLVDQGIDPARQGMIAIGQDVIEIAKAFFKLLIELFQIVLAGAMIRTA
jgi:hypothetical protein